MTFLRRVSALAAANALAGLAQLGAVLILVRLLPGAEWSRAALLLSVYAAALALGGLNMHLGLVYLYRRVPAHGRRALVAQTALLLACGGALSAAIIVAVAAAGWLPSFATGAAGAAASSMGSAIAIAAAVLIEMPTLAGPQLLLAEERAGAAAAFEAGAAVGRLAALVAPAALGLGPRGIGACLVVYAAGRLVAFVVVAVRVTPPGSWAPRSTLVKRQLAYTLPLGLALAAGVLNQHVDKWMVAALDPGHFGAFVVAAQEVPVVPVLAYAAAAALATRMVHAFRVGDRARARAYWMAQTSRIGLVVVPVTAVLILVAPELGPLLFGPDFAAAVLPFQLYSLVLLHRVAEYGAVLRAAGDTRALYQGSALCLTANLVLGLPLTWRLGMLGTCLGTLLAYAVSWLFVMERIAAAMGTGLGSVFPWRTYGRMLVAAGGAGAIAWEVAGAVITTTSAAPGAPVLLGVAVKVGVFVTLLPVLLALLGGWSPARLLHADRGLRGLHPMPEDDEHLRHALGS